MRDRKFVVDLDQGSKDDRDLLGGKGANLAGWTHLGLSRPSGSSITTEVCRSRCA